MRSYTCRGVQNALEKAASEARPFNTAMIPVETLEDAARIIEGQRNDLGAEYRANERLRASRDAWRFLSLLGFGIWILFALVAGQ